MRAKLSRGPDHHNVALMLRAQSILFSRFHEILAPYKYAGYPMLIRTVQLETSDTTFFNKPVPLLPPATELCYHTMHCSALNAEELRREGGLECLMQALDRCLGVVTSASRADELPVQVCLHVVNCCRVAARFEPCRTAILEQPRLVADLCRLLEFKNLPDLCIAVQIAVLLCALMYSCRLAYLKLVFTSCYYRTSSCTISRSKTAESKSQLSQTNKSYSTSSLAFL